MTLPDQGKVACCLTGDQYANGSSWHMTGLNIRFKDWRFIHRARLNVVPLNANKSRFSNASSTCRHCTQPETLPHVVCHCRPQMTQIRDHHNKIVDRLTNAVRFGEITTDKTVRTSGLRLRPDIVVEEKNEVLIIDVTLRTMKMPYLMQPKPSSTNIRFSKITSSLRVKSVRSIPLSLVPWVRGTSKTNCC